MSNVVIDAALMKTLVSQQYAELQHYIVVLNWTCGVIGLLLVAAYFLVPLIRIRAKLAASTATTAQLTILIVGIVVVFIWGGVRMSYIFDDLAMKRAPELHVLKSIR